MIALLVAALAFGEPDIASEPETEAGQFVPDDPVALLTGRFSNADQYESAPEDWRREPAAGNPYEWLDLQYATHTRVEAPELGEHVIYLEWRSGAEDGPISRQRLWVFRQDEEGALAGFDFFTLRDPEPFAGRAEEEGAFAALTEEDLVGYPDGCLVRAHQSPGGAYHFAVAGQDCVITAQSGTEMRIHASVRASRTFFTYRESGISMDGEVVFQVPGAPQPYAFRRLSDKD
ncbi:CpcT/CpeT family chromophore lyase [Glycocaulis sp.]